MLFPVEVSNKIAAHVTFIYLSFFWMYLLEQLNTDLRRVCEFINLVTQKDFEFVSHERGILDLN